MLVAVNSVDESMNVLVDLLYPIAHLDLEIVVDWLLRQGEVLGNDVVNVKLGVVKEVVHPGVRPYFADRRVLRF